MTRRRDDKHRSPARGSQVRADDSGAPRHPVAGHGWWGVLAVAICVLLALGANAIFVEDAQARRLNAMGAVALGAILAVVLVTLG